MPARLILFLLQVSISKPGNNINEGGRRQGFHGYVLENGLRPMHVGENAQVHPTDAGQYFPLFIACAARF